MSFLCVQVEIAKLYQEAKVNPLAGCLPTLVTLPVWISLYRALSNVADEGLLTEGFFWIPSLAGPTSTAAQKAVSCCREGASALLRDSHSRIRHPLPQMTPLPLLTRLDVSKKSLLVLVGPQTEGQGRPQAQPWCQRLQGACTASGHVGNLSGLQGPSSSTTFFWCKARAPGPGFRFWRWGM